MSIPKKPPAPARSDSEFKDELKRVMQKSLLRMTASIGSDPDAQSPITVRALEDFLVLYIKVYRTEEIK